MRGREHDHHIPGPEADHLKDQLCQRIDELQADKDELIRQLDEAERENAELRQQIRIARCA